MTRFKKTIVRGGFERLYFSAAHRFLRPFVAGAGVILTLHHVRPPRPDRFQPNRLLEVTPAFLDDVIGWLRRSQLDLVSLDEMHRRLIEADFQRRFVCVTVDDGYRDTLQWAYPILKRHQVPFTVYVPTSFPDRLGELWWLALEAVVARNRRVQLLIDGQSEASTARPSMKSAIYSMNSTVGSAASRAKRSFDASCAIWPRAIKSTLLRSATSSA